MFNPKNYDDQLDLIQNYIYDRRWSASRAFEELCKRVGGVENSFITLDDAIEFERDRDEHQK